MPSRRKKRAIKFVLRMINANSVELIEGLLLYTKLSIFLLMNTKELIDLNYSKRINLPLSTSTPAIISVQSSAMKMHIT